MPQIKKPSRCTCPGANGTPVRHMWTNSIKVRVPFPLCWRSPGTETSRTTNKVTASYTRTCTLMTRHVSMGLWLVIRNSWTTQFYCNRRRKSHSALHNIRSTSPLSIYLLHFFFFFSASATKSYKTQRQTALPRLTVISKPVAAL